MQIRFNEIFAQETTTFLPGMIGEIEDVEAIRLIKKRADGSSVAELFRVAEPIEKAIKPKSFERAVRINNK